MLSGNFNRMKFDRTKWYTIDYAKLTQLAPIDDSLYDQLPPGDEPEQLEDEGQREPTITKESFRDSF